MQKIGGVLGGVLLLLLGAVWIGQGLGYIKGSFMTGAMQWFWIGLPFPAARPAPPDWGAWAGPSRSY